MAWNRKQIITIQIYRRAAKLGEAEYRHILHTTTGTFTSRDPTLTNFHFDKIMPVLELKAAESSAAGNPMPRQITKLSYWRSRHPDDGSMNPRQRHKILDPDEGLWPKLCQSLPSDKQTMPYLCSIAAAACKYHVTDFWTLKAWQANLLIEALKDRLTHALRPNSSQGAAEHSEASPIMEEVPF